MTHLKGNYSSKNKQSVSYFAQYVSELALETREFELLFGRLEKNAVRRRGIVDKFIDEEETQSIISLVAEDIENKGKFIKISTIFYNNLIFALKPKVSLKKQLNSLTYAKSINVFLNYAIN